MKKAYKIIIWLVLVIGTFLIGYYLRAYIPLHKDLPYSPYEAFNKTKLPDSIETLEYVVRMEKYPTSYFLIKILNPILGDFYIVYLLGAIIIFFLGKEITNRNTGGFLAFLIYAIAPENLLQYVRTIGTSGCCYVFMWASLLFFVRYLKNKENFNLIIFTGFSLLAFTSYHTGATALAMLLIGLLVSLAYSVKLTKKILFFILGLTIFHIFWILIVDTSVLVLIKKAFIGTNYPKLFFVVLALLLFLSLLFFIKEKKVLQSEYIPLLTILPASILIFCKSNFFGGLLSLGAKNYYSSSITLNNYLAQALLTHIYIFPLFPILFKKELNAEYLVLRGWLIGLVLICGGLISKNFYSRIFDYSFPLIFVLFGLYWAKNKKFRIFVGAATAILLTISQLLIYNDPFSMRRYYSQNEISSAKNIITAHINWTNKTIASDFRTSALFSYLGKNDIKFGRSESGPKLHNTIFYEYKNITKLDIDYIVLSESMKNIVYDANFETTPVNDDFFKYYRTNFNEVYNDGLMYVYEIRK